VSVHGLFWRVGLTRYRIDQPLRFIELLPGTYQTIVESRDRFFLFPRCAGITVSCEFSHLPA
jgi:hypothetical protein